MSEHQSINQVKVGLSFQKAEVIPLGQLAERDGTIYFEYDRSFDLPISPIRLPLEPGVKTFSPTLFEGLPGVFNDSLPDGWGRLLLDRLLRTKGVLPAEFSPLDRLTHVGQTGLGALVYEPDKSTERYDGEVDLNELATHSQEVLKGEADEVLVELIQMNGSSAGARPKALIGLDKSKKSIIHGRHEIPNDYEHWMVKFGNDQDGADAGAIEFIYSIMAKEAGIEMPETHLFEANKGVGHFAIKRFDREGANRLHMHTASGLLHSNFRVPSLDYEDLLTLTGALAKDLREVKKMFRLAVFNVLSHNRDDHGKNFTFLMDSQGEWRLSPSYDLTFSSGPRGHQSTMVMGEGQNPSIKDLGKLGKSAGISDAEISVIMEQTMTAMSQWKTLAKNYGVSSSNVKLISSRIGK